MSKQEIIQTIATKFYVWFLTLSILTISMTLMILGIDDRLISVRIIGGIALAPLALPLKMIFKEKIEKQDQEFKIKRKQLRNERLKIMFDSRLSRIKTKQEYKLEKYKIKHSK